MVLCSPAWFGKVILKETKSRNGKTGKSYIFFPMPYLVVINNVTTIFIHLLHNPGMNIQINLQFVRSCYYDCDETPSNLLPNS